MAYRELPTTGPLLACLWTNDGDGRGHTASSPTPASTSSASTAACIVAGPATARAPHHRRAATTFGVRFRVGAAGAALGLPAAELLDLSVPLEDVWGDGAARSRTCTSSRTAVLRSAAAAADPLVRAAATGTPRARDRDRRPPAPAPLPRRRRLRAQDARAHPAVPAVPDARRATDLARLALEAGYADQAHLTRECTRLAGLPPAALLAEGAGPAGERSVSFKTAARAPATMAA